MEQGGKFNIMETRVEETLYEEREREGAEEEERGTNGEVGLGIIY